jgi:TPP-dependent pyruvate/acetoin dehydrogenase alpha subunit
MSYRVGDHSTSDFSQRYRDEEEMKKWGHLLEKVSNPIHRLEKYLTNKGMITEEKTAKLRNDAKLSVRESLKAASVLQKPHLDSLFEDVYESIPPHIEAQR